MRQGYRFGVSWIAMNDEPSCLDFDAISEMISVMLLADLFGKDPLQVAKDIIKFRTRQFDAQEN